jgi:hypothetical protein
MSDSVLTEAQVADFRALAGMIVPASAQYRVPGADDPVIFADIVKSIGRDHGAIVAALARAAEVAGGAVAGLDAAGQARVTAALQGEAGAVGVLVRQVLLCYYRDDRVMVSLGLEPRAPFPKGHVLEQGDWSLLDQVKARKPFWRPAS